MDDDDNYSKTKFINSRHCCHCEKMSNATGYKFVLGVGLVMRL